MRRLTWAVRGAGAAVVAAGRYVIGRRWRRPAAGPMSRAARKAARKQAVARALGRRRP